MNKIITLFSIVLAITMLSLPVLCEMGNGESGGNSGGSSDAGSSVSSGSDSGFTDMA